MTNRVGHAVLAILQDASCKIEKADDCTQGECLLEFDGRYGTYRVFCHTWSGRLEVFVLFWVWIGHRFLLWSIIEGQGLMQGYENDLQFVWYDLVWTWSQDAWSSCPPECLHSAYQLSMTLSKWIYPSRVALLSQHCRSVTCISPWSRLDPLHR